MWVIVTRMARYSRIAERFDENGDIYFYRKENDDMRSLDSQGEFDKYPKRLTPVLIM